MKKVDEDVLVNTPAPEPTFGEKLVGVSFNPSKNPLVDKVKQLAAEMADIVNQDFLSRSANLPVTSNIAHFAINDILTASMKSVRVLVGQD